MATTIRIRFVSTGGIASGLIRAAQLGWPLTHVDAAIDGAWLGAHAAGGVALRPISYDAGPATTERVVAIDVCEDAAARFRAFLLAQLGKPYDFPAFAEFAALAAGLIQDAPETPIAEHWGSSRRWFCSELVAAALVDAAVLPRGLPDQMRRVTPQNLAFALAAIAQIEETRA